MATAEGAPVPTLLNVAFSALRAHPGSSVSAITGLIQAKYPDRKIREPDVRHAINGLVAAKKLFAHSVRGQAVVYFASETELNAHATAQGTEAAAHAAAAAQAAEAARTARQTANDNSHDSTDFVLQHGLELAQEADREGSPIPLDFPVRDDADPERAAKKNIIAHALHRTFVRTSDGNYFAATPYKGSRRYLKYVKSEIENAVTSDIRLPFSLFDPMTVNAKGNDVPKKLPQIMREISTFAPNGWAYSSTTDTSHLTTDGVFLKRCWERLPISPRFDDEFDAYLHTLDDDQYAILCDYFVHATRTDHPCVCLVMAGPNSTGKDLIPLAAAGLYTADGTHGEGSLALNNFNPSIVESPFAVCSEGLPVDFRGEPIKPNVLKASISRQFHVINAKNQQPVKLFGNLRWVISANDADFYQTKEHLIEQDAAAVCRRFVVLNMPQAAADYLAKLGGMAYTLPRWITGERRAVRHVAWIVANHQIPAERADDRFGLKARAPELRRRLISNSPTAGTIISGIVGYLVDDSARRALKPALRVGGGRVGVNVGKLVGCWRFLGTGGIGAAAAARPPQERVIAAEIQRMAVVGDEGTSVDGLAFISIDLEILLGHARNLGLPTEEIRKRIEGEVS